MGCIDRNNKFCCAPCMRLYPVVGPTGPQGIAGTIGPTGPTGPAGSIEANPYNLYVSSSAPAGSDGSQASPFQAIEEALAVAKPNSTINVLPGTYSISNQINLNIPGLTLKGYAGSDILLENSVVPLEFIQVAGNNDQILDNEIYGPEQAGDSSNWVVNRGFVTQGSATNLLVRSNIFYSLRQPTYLNPNSTGIIMDIIRK